MNVIVKMSLHYMILSKKVQLDNKTCAVFEVLQFDDRPFEYLGRTPG